MSAQTAMNLLDLVEFALWIAACFLFWKKGQNRRFPRMGAFLTLHVAAMPVLLFFFYASGRHWFHNHSFMCYFWAYWAVYIASAVLLYFVCIEVFRSALDSFPGLQWLGTIAFRWAAVVSAIMSFSTLNFGQPHGFAIAHLAFRLMRPVSILELCLLGFICVSMNALQLPARSLAFGIALGFGLMACNDLIVGFLLMGNRSSLIVPLDFVYESLILVSLGVWVSYCALPEPVRKPVLLPASSLLFRWNEIAMALGHTGTQVAVLPVGSSLLGNAESGIEGILANNLNNRESEA